VTRLALLTEIPAPYRHPLFAALARRLELELLFLRERNPERPYRFDPDELHFSWRVLPGAEITVGNRWLVLSRGTVATLDAIEPQVLALGGWNQPAFAVAFRWARRGRVPVVLWVESTGRESRSGRAEALKRSVLRRADGFVVPGSASREYLLRLGAPGERIVVAPNAVDATRFASAGRKEKDGPPLVLTVARLAPEKGIDVLLRAVEGLPVEVAVAGAGPEEERLRELAPPNVRFLGHLDGEALTALYARADVFALPSLSEPWGIPLNEAAHTGLPLVATNAAGAAHDLIEDGVNGFRVPAGDVAALREALSRLADDPELRTAMGARSRELAGPFTPDAWADAVAGLASRLHEPGRTRVLMVARTRYQLPLRESLERKFGPLRERLDIQVLAAAADGTSGGSREGFVLVAPRGPAFLAGALFYLGLPFRVAGALRRRPIDAVLAQSPYEGAAVVLGRALARRPTRLVVEVHGDWRTATRLYGSRLRPALSPLADRAARFGLQHADRVRTVAPFTSRLVRALGIEPAAEFPAFVDLRTFAATEPAPLPPRTSFVFVGVLERYKFVDGLAVAWRRVAGEAPDATLRVVGDGSERATVEALVRDVTGRTAWDRELAPAEVRGALDDATALVLPSRSEGLPRIAIEAFCRGRPVIGARAGGIPDLVTDGVEGLLFEPEDPDALAEAMLRLVREYGLAERLAAGARSAAERWQVTPAEFAERLRALLEG
jgi:glycosyltransferase involved in cell wall biosynthesis